MEKAQNAQADLIEIAPNANPPVAKIIDFQKFRYDENKKEQAGRKSSGGELKELWLSPRIAEHDLQIRLTRAREFLKNGNKVKLNVKFRGREMAHPELGTKVLNNALGQLGEGVLVERESKFEGRNLSVIVAKGKGGKDNGQTKDQ